MFFHAFYVNESVESDSQKGDKVDGKFWKPQKQQEKSAREHKEGFTYIRKSREKRMLSVRLRISVCFALWIATACNLDAVIEN